MINFLPFFRGRTIEIIHFEKKIWRLELVQIIEKNRSQVPLKMNPKIQNLNLHSKNFPSVRSPEYAVWTHLSSSTFETLLCKIFFSRLSLLISSFNILRSSTLALYCTSPLLSVDCCILIFSYNSANSSLRLTSCVPRISLSWITFISRFVTRKPIKLIDKQYEYLSAFLEPVQVVFSVWNVRHQLLVWSWAVCVLRTVERQYRPWSQQPPFS